MNSKMQPELTLGLVYNVTSDYHNVQLSPNSEQASTSSEQPPPKLPNQPPSWKENERENRKRERYSGIWLTFVLYKQVIKTSDL